MNAPHFKDCTHVDEERIVQRSLKNIEYRRQYNLRKKGKL